MAVWFVPEILGFLSSVVTIFTEMATLTLVYSTPNRNMPLKQRLFVALLGILHFRNDVISATEVEAPVLNISGPHLDVPLNSHLYVECTGRYPLTWYFENPMTKEVSELAILNETFQPSSERGHFSSVVHLEFNTYDKTGNYSCAFNGTHSNSSISLYIFVNDQKQLMLPLNSFPFEMIEVFESDPVIIPCLPTNSTAEVTLWKSKTLTPDLNSGERFCDSAVRVTMGCFYDPTKGFTLSTKLRGKFCCKVRHNELSMTNDFLVVSIGRPVYHRLLISMFIEGAQYAVVNDSLRIECTIPMDDTMIHRAYSYPSAAATHTSVSSSVISSSFVLFKKILTVSRIQKVDEGFYRCSFVTTLYEVFFYETFVHVHDKKGYPIVKEREQSVDFVGKFKEIPASQKRLWKHDGEIPETGRKYEIVNRKGESILHIHNLSKDDSGVYTFSRYDEASFRTDIPFTLAVKSQPEVSTWVVEVAKSKISEMFCRAEGFPLPNSTLIWKLNCEEERKNSVYFEIEYEEGKYFPNAVKPIRIIKNEDSSVTLLLRVKNDIPGRYYCRSTNEMGTTEKRILSPQNGKAHVTYRGIPVLRIERSGVSFSLTCVANRSVYEGVEISKESSDRLQTTAPENHNAVPFQSKYQIKSTVTFNSISKIQSGIYKCSANFKNHSLHLEEEAVFIFVSDKRHPFIYLTNMNSSRIEVDQNDTLELLCYVSGLPHPEVRWYHNERHVFHNTSGLEFLDDFQKLIIPHFDKQHNGFYECRVNNTDETESRNTILCIKEAPHILETNMDSDKVERVAGNYFQLICRVGGTPHPHITWHHNGKPLPENLRKDVHDASQRLAFVPLVEEDSGTYECRAENSLGLVTRNISLIVKDGHKEANIETVIVIAIPVILVVGLLTVWLLIVKKPWKPVPQETQPSPQPASRPKRKRKLKFYQKYEFPRRRLKLGRTLGKGAFGKVVKAKAFGLNDFEMKTTVAVKMPKDMTSMTQRKALITEIKIMMSIGHHVNILNLLGAVTSNPRELMAVMEYCRYGNLRKYLLRHKRWFRSSAVADDASDSESDTSETDDFISLASQPKPKSPRQKRKNRLHIASSATKPKPGGFASESSGSDSSGLFYTSTRRKHWITTRDLICYAFQCARGMEYITSMNTIHRDLAARNVLLSDNKIVKICDFGLAEDLGEYKIRRKPEKLLMPVKWMAMESLLDGIYSERSDVWSFGVLLWEFFSLGGEPYPGMNTDANFLPRLREGYRMEKPKFSPENMYQIMRKCWQEEPLDRPTFAELVNMVGDTLEETVRQYYVTLNEPYAKMNVSDMAVNKTDALISDKDPSPEDPLMLQTVKAADDGHDLNPVLCDAERTSPETAEIIPMATFPM